MATEGKENENDVEKEFEEFLKSEELEEYDKIPVNRVKLGRGVKAAFWFLRIYIALMVVLVVIGFSHVI
ncbi:MAG: hypothetical protein M0Z77_07590 [Thermoplasmatales archaeon]|jgi:hypothetical protein|nr:hypothetical protein [Thermoplasmatales archaeon]